MAGMLYLPRLFVYHSQVAPGSEASELFKIMERRLLRGIINPSMIIVWILGLTMAYLSSLDPIANLWFGVKFACVIVLSAVHGLFVRYWRAFAADRRPKSETYFRIINEVPALLMVVIVIMVIVKPF
jgi:putative membrane protein